MHLQNVVTLLAWIVVPPSLALRTVFPLFPAQDLANHTSNIVLSDDQEAQCHRITEPSMPGLNPTNCEYITQNLCRRFQLGPVLIDDRDKWHWFELPGCALAFYLSTTAQSPGLQGCLRIMGEIREKCATNSRYNAGTSNVKTLPDFTGDGQAVDNWEARFIMAPERLTL